MIGIRTGIGVGRQGALLKQNEPEVKVYIEGLSTLLSSGQILKLNTFVKTVKTGIGVSALSDIADAMYLWSGETSESSLKNIVRNANHSTLAGTPNPAFTPYLGFLSDGSHGYIRSNFNPTLHGVKYTQNDAAISIYSRTDRLANPAAVSAGVLSGGIYSYLFAKIATGLSGFINAGVTSTVMSGGTTKGLLSLMRINPTTIKVARDKILGIGTASNSTGLNNAEVYFGARSNNGTADAFDNLRLSFGYIGRSLSEFELGVLVDAITDYQKSVSNYILSIIGDSISNEDISALDTDWARLVPEPTYYKLNHAVSGNTIIAHMDGQVANCASDNADKIIIFLGTNDNNAGNMTTLQAKVESNISALKVSNPKAIIYYVNVLPRWTDVTGTTIVDKSNIRSAIASACTNQGVACWDTYSTPWITAADTVDGLHTNPTGASKIWSEIALRI